MHTKTDKFRVITLSILFVVVVIFGCSSSTLTGDKDYQTPTLPPTQTLISGVNLHLIQDICLQPSNTQSFSVVEGNIATLSDEANIISLWNLDNEPSLALGRVEILGGVSSTYEKIAYIDADRQEVVVVSAQGEEIAAVPAQDNWVEVLDWVDGENLLIGNMPLRGNGGWSPPSSTIILNIASGKYIEIFPDYPDIYPYTSGPPNFDRYSYSITSYDSTLTRVVYPGVTQIDFFIALWDVTNKHEIVRLQLPYSYYPPKWKSDGSSFIISAPPKYADLEGKLHRNILDELPYVDGNELFSVSRDGEIKRLTFLTTKYKAEESAYMWSPNGKLVAFWLKIENDNRGWQLAILNTETGKITNYCVGSGDGSFPIVWSPDDDQIISTFRNADNGKLESILVNINTEIAYVIHEEEVVFGWMDP